MAGYQRITDTGLQRARAGKSLSKWVNDLTPGNVADTIITDAGLVYNLNPGEQVVITMLCMGLMTASDSAHVDVVVTDAANGVGNVTAMTHHNELNSGTAKPEVPMMHEIMTPPMVVKYSSGARSITMRVTMNDAAAEITLGWDGWVEDEASYPGDL